MHFEAQVAFAGEYLSYTSESMGQNWPTPIRGVQYLGHWIPRADVRQIAARTEPNPRYRRIGPFSEVPNVRGIDGRLYRQIVPFSEVPNVQGIDGRLYTLTTMIYIVRAHSLMDWFYSSWKNDTSCMVYVTYHWRYVCRSQLLMCTHFESSTLIPWVYVCNEMIILHLY